VTRWVPHLDSWAVEVVSNGFAEEDVNPRDLVRRWEANQWSTDDINLEADAEGWRALPGGLKSEVRLLLQKFVIGEYTAADNLPHLMRGAPDEEALLYLCTQAADEARHSTYVSRVWREVVGEEGPLAEILERAWTDTTPAMRELTLFERRLADELVAAPGDYVPWLRLVAMFHVVTESVLALAGQRSIVRGLGRTSKLSGIRDGFVSMTRDEGRHVSFGMTALRRGGQEGYGDAILEVIEHAASLVATIDLDRRRGASANQKSAADGRRLVDLLATRAGALAAERQFQEHLVVAGQAAVDGFLSGADEESPPR
jgi:ribonucleotide reductase beta subunit family protein with ferritin-like domain